ncbi:MAG TPA: hypothetical protein VFU57_10430 [Candidatus Acidoferrales bacterium]|nr:hypothetical protein [Candidatus Acidoferrales bacterium]
MEGIGPYNHRPEKGKGRRFAEGAILRYQDTNIRGQELLSPESLRYKRQELEWRERGARSGPMEKIGPYNCKAEKPSSVKTHSLRSGRV